MSILTRQERERLVLELYNQGKTIREIAKEARMSFRDIGIILNKVIENKIEASQEQQDIDKAKQNREQEQQHLSISSQAYKLFSDRKTPLEVAIALNLKESEATKFYREYWKLKQLYYLNIVYEELRGDIEPFLNLYKLAKRIGMSIKQVINLLEIANNDLPDIQCRYERLKREVNTLECNKQQSHRALSYFNNQIEMKSKALTSYTLSCIRERRQIENLYNEKTRLEDIVTEFKNNNEECLDKIKKVAEEKIREVLTNGKFLLQFAVASVIESLRSNPELCNFMMYYNSNNGAPSFMLGGQQQHQEQSFNGRYAALILEESEKTYNKLTTELMDRVMAAAASLGHHRYHY